MLNRMVIYEIVSPHLSDVHWSDVYQNQPITKYFSPLWRTGHRMSTTAAAVARLFWLVGSSWFYDDPKTGKEGRIGRQKQAFIELAYQALQIP